MCNKSTKTIRNEKIMNILGRIVYAMLGATIGAIIVTEYFINIMS